MTATDEALTGAPAPWSRFFGWTMLAVLAAFLINNVLTLAYDVPSIATAILSGGPMAWAPIALYAATIALAVFHVFAHSQNTLRADAARITAVNTYIIRACFWTVFLVGITDAAIALMRVENILPIFFGEELAKEFGRARFVGIYVHVPLVIVGFALALVTRTLGFTWLALMIVAAELLIVLSRFVFSYEQALMGDLVRYWYAALFLFASAYTLLEEGHVRVDVLYAGFAETRKGFMNAFGSIFLGMSTAWVILLVGLDGKTSIINSPVMAFEVTQTGGTGMFIKYQMAIFLAVFAVTMMIQFVSYFFEAVADMRGEPGKRVVTAAAH